MIAWLKEVGRGKRGARDLTYEECLQAAEEIMSLRATPAQIGAFFIAERIKMESVEELEAFVEACRKTAHREALNPDGLDCAGPYDGRKKTFFASFACSFVLAAAGLPVTLHGTDSLPPKWGVTLHDMLKLVGIRPEELPRETLAAAAKRTGLLYVPAEQWCPPLKQLRPIREQLGMRTVLNTAEKLIDYGHSPYLVFGVYHNTVFDRLARLMTKLNYRKALIVQGAEGSEDLFVDRPTRTYLVEQGNASLQVVSPEAWGLDTPVPEVEWTAALQIETTEAVLRGDADMAFINQVLLNAAYRLHLAGRVGSVEEGLYTGKALLENRQAWSVYVEWRDLLAQSYVHR
ncbi:anthranilate phosphoribosyltransferase [Cohnella sp. CIP 111063]|uniref:anthranilate phosphoribosyltransferase n=1 Tax=unclassified Cohnella TaxID=2636738 RepID=UPI000B8BDF5B|nr:MULTISPECIES: anthranilate phosphoribosyltransferase [unclassified Cohnella]OXS62463.1 anthranilate phosphoribosyltransferase [Cohnella sp. CIP 111063]PRX74704.1 anthranilate phosphoribosyltransferase [Cohnella sp. SGD-V74]